jgi:hypothetical protein
MKEGDVELDEEVVKDYQQISYWLNPYWKWAIRLMFIFTD